MLGDWSHPYLTMDFKTEANIIRALGKIIGNGHLHKGAKPVHWCVDCRSALAEAEVEYYDKTSPSIDVAFQAVDQDALKAKFAVSNVNGPISLVIWTTTPWTLPANRAISIAPDFDYALVQIDGQAVILAKDLVESVMQRIGVTDYTILGTVKVRSLSCCALPIRLWASTFRQSSAITLPRMPVPVPFTPRGHGGRLCDRSEIRPRNR